MIPLSPTTPSYTHFHYFNISTLYATVYHHYSKKPDFKFIFETLLFKFLYWVPMQHAHTRIYIRTHTHMPTHK